MILPLSWLIRLGGCKKKFCKRDRRVCQYTGGPIKLMIKCWIEKLDFISTPLIQCQIMIIILSFEFISFVNKISFEFENFHAIIKFWTIINLKLLATMRERYWLNRPQTPESERNDVILKPYSDDKTYYEIKKFLKNFGTLPPSRRLTSLPNISAKNSANTFLTGILGLSLHLVIIELKYYYY